MRINFNRSTNVRNIPLIQMTMILIVSAIVAFVLVIYRGLVGSVPGWLVLTAVGLIIGVVVVSGLVAQVLRAFNDLREWH